MANEYSSNFLRKWLHCCAGSEAIDPYFTSERFCVANYRQKGIESEHYITKQVGFLLPTPLPVRLMSATLYAEEHLVSAVLAGHTTAFTTLHNRYAPLLTSVLLRMINDRERVNDLLQDTFLRVWTNLHRYDPEQGRLTTWLSTIARNIALDELKGRQVRLLADSRLANCTDDWCHASISEGIPHQMLINYLSPKYRKVIELVYYRDYTRQEIAETLGLPLGTVKTHYRTAMQQLRQVLRHDSHQY